MEKEESKIKVRYVPVSLGSYLSELGMVSLGFGLGLMVSDFWRGAAIAGVIALLFLIQLLLFWKTGHGILDYHDE